MAKASRASESLAGEVWRQIFDYIVATAPERVAVLERLGLTPAESRALTSLDPNAGRSMRSLAEAWACDPSNATWLVDKLEQQGLARRVAQDGDRRVKSVVLTPKGKRLRAELLESQYTPPRDLVALPQRDLKALSAATSKLPARRLSPKPRI
ncbi:MAG TPA: MarR family transcriptional regulator [Candidatus Dormibacteraeota bacterium]|nr:MarR family transcriptional regulator [Candidatus Dormibacteraeota bacterium]